MWTAKNPFLQGPYEPLVNEFSIEHVYVEGEIPRDLDGALYRTGSNQHFKPSDPDKFHWFDGDGMVHAFFLKDGKVSYANKWVETDGLKIERKLGHAIYNGIYGRGGKPQPELPEGAPMIKSVAGINVIRLGGKILTMHEVDSFYYEIDPHSLDTLGKFDFGGIFKGMITAHSHRDEKTGETLFFSLDNERQEVECFSADTLSGKVTSKVKTPMPITPWCHDFTFTEDYYVFFFGPLSFRPLSKDYIPKGKSSWTFDPEHAEGKVLIVNRKTGKATWIDTEPFTVGHYLNSYQSGNQIIVDASVTKLLEKRSVHVEEYMPFPLTNDPSPFSGPQLWRIIIDLSAETVRYERLGDFGAEFVRPNELIYGQKHRYGYMAGINNPRGNSKGFNCCVKYDYLTGKNYFQYISPVYDMVPGEPIYVPREGSVEEDDGYILQVWYDPARNASEMIILSAQDFDGEPLARVKLDHHVPLGFHGNWIPNLG